MKDQSTTTDWPREMTIYVVTNGPTASLHRRLLQTRLKKKPLGVMEVRDTAYLRGSLAAVREALAMQLAAIDQVLLSEIADEQEAGSLEPGAGGPWAVEGRQA